ncbi:glutamine--fructose-6-phosphate transaminase (isomerizing) [Halobacteriovorax sp. JY17]|uniref:glutamine--fructose-6-phosphate transaminase (isomerizing) n=1 Tax=Halobacteriovorax sp. JY17 TaxID=2014617 RepID=UPI000C496B9D|nr:glutamine--fructose-6-phosphate transaminase (isomerizing) [Halobacteriovorax sp. JY17]PIK14538.1 MAG: glutamine--fructose-6-phosphate transaminase (isomerizing) [Halobacteriovorax sp. JY17]
MCGIVGHIGPKDSVNIVLEGLRRLEYRGYDSAGVSFIDESDELQIYKKSGKLDNLKGLLEGKDFKARMCIGHTRWATHGEVNDTNSHPHMKDHISIVHNGIIENASALRKELAAGGYEFQSQTDSEVFLSLLTRELATGKSFKQAMLDSFSLVEGNSAFVVLNKDVFEIMSIKKGAPLVCGINTVDSEAFVSSDPYALAGMASRLYFPADNVLCHLSAKNKNLINFYDSEGNPTENYMSKKQDMSVGPTDKGEFEHFMLKEIHEQPELIRSLTQFYFHGEGLESLLKAGEFVPSKFHMTACGTAYYAGLLIRDFLEAYNRIPCSPELASEFRYRKPLLQEGESGLFISQSGETADTLAAQELCTENNIKTLSIVNVDGSTLFRNCDNNLLIRAGMEIGVASTKAFTQQVLTGRLLSLALSKEMNEEASRVKLTAKFSLLAEKIDHLISRSEEIKNIAESIYNHKGFFYTGRGIYFPVALEGALKLKEIAYVHAEGYAAGELKHGPIAMIDEDMVNVALVGPELFEKTVSNIQEIKARKGVILTIGPKDHEELAELSDYYFGIDFDGLEELSPIYINIVNQLLAYYIAKYKGTDIDKPRNLAKSVTVE